MGSSVTRRRSSYSMPGGSGADDFRAKQEPQFEPVDDLSRFVADRIREAETEPVADQVEPNGQPMAYRYAGYVREDCKVFRRILAAYQRAYDNRRAHPDDLASAGALLALLGVVTGLANRWDTHPDFQEGWRLS